MKAFQKAKAGGTGPPGPPGGRFKGFAADSPSKAPRSESLKGRLLANETVAHSKRSSDVAIAVEPDLIKESASFDEPDAVEIDISAAAKPKATAASRFAAAAAATRLMGNAANKPSAVGLKSKLLANEQAAHTKRSSDVAITIEPNLITETSSDLSESPLNSGKSTPKKRVSFTEPLTDDSSEIAGITGAGSVEKPTARLGSVNDAADNSAAAADNNSDDNGNKGEDTLKNIQQAAKAARASLEAAEIAREIEIEEKMRLAETRRKSLENANSVKDKERSRRHSLMGRLQEKSQSSPAVASKPGERSRSFTQAQKKPSITETEAQAFSKEVKVRESISGSPRTLPDTRKSFETAEAPPPPPPPAISTLLTPVPVPAPVLAPVAVEARSSGLAPPPASAARASRAQDEEDSISDDASSEEAFIGTEEPIQAAPSQPPPSSVPAPPAPPVAPAVGKSDSGFSDELPASLRSVNVSRLFAAPGAPDLPVSRPPGTESPRLFQRGSGSPGGEIGRDSRVPFSTSSSSSSSEEGRATARQMSMPPNPPPPLPQSERGPGASASLPARAGSTGAMPSHHTSSLHAPSEEDPTRSPSFTRMFGEAPPTMDQQPTPRIPDFRVEAQSKEESHGGGGVARASYGAVEQIIHHSSPHATSSGVGVDINEAGHRNIHETIRQCLETELENTTFAIRGDLQGMSRNMTNGTKLMLGEHISSVASRFTDVIDAVDMRIKVAFDCYDEVAREELVKVDDLGGKVDALGKALNASKREYEYSQEKLVADFSRKVEDERRLFDASTHERQTEIKENFADIQRSVMQMREADRREVFDLVKEAHDTSQRVLMDHHDQVEAMHRDFEKRLARFQLELKEQHDMNHAAMLQMMDKTVGRAEENQNNLLRQQRELVEQLTTFMRKQDSARAADKAEILSLAGITKEAATKLHENSQENLIYVQEEVVDLRRKLFLQEQANYDIKREHSRLLQKQSIQAVPGGADSASVAHTIAEAQNTPGSGRDRGTTSPTNLQRPFSPTEDSPGTLAAMSPSFISSNPLKAAATDYSMSTAALGGGGGGGGSGGHLHLHSSPVPLPGMHNQSLSFSHGGSTQLSYNRHGLPDYANLKFGSSPSPSSSPLVRGQQEAKESYPDAVDISAPASGGRVDKLSSRGVSGARSPSPSPSASASASASSSTVRFKNLKASKAVNGNPGLVSNSPYIMSVSSDASIRNKQMRDQMKPKPGQQHH